jgi:hypothetical protein
MWNEMAAQFTNQQTIHSWYNSTRTPAVDSG